VSEREYATRKGALLARLEHNRVEPGHWIVEGYRVKRGPKYWRAWSLTGGVRLAVIENSMNVCVWVTFTEVLEIIAERTHQRD
jgi:hypothetical protein